MDGQAIAERKQEIQAICHELGVESLALFGSSARHERNAESDIDFVARFDRTRGQLFDRYFELMERLERLLGRPVDLVIEESIRNPHFREAVEADRVAIHGS